MTKIKPTETSDFSKKKLLATQEELDNFVARGGKVEHQKPEPIQTETYIRAKDPDQRKQRTKSSYLPKLEGE